MDTELKSKWTAALRSGEYEQCRGRICNTPRTEFCCLGVLGVVGEMNLDELDKSYDPLRKALGMALDAHNPLRQLYYMNDTEKKTFAEIADWIDANL